MNILVVGAGIGGIYSSLILKQKYPGAHVYLIERSSDIGGLYSSFNDLQAGTFDKGMHIFYETLNPLIDDIIFSALPKDQWIRLEGNRKDLAGVFHNNLLDTHSPYVALDSLPNSLLSESIAGLFHALENPSKVFTECDNLREFFCSRFGVPLTDHLIEPIVRKLWHVDSNRLHASASRIVLMDRIKAFSHTSMLDLSRSSHIRSRLAFPDQLELDLSLRSKQAGLYPTNYGLSNVLSGFKKLLSKCGINVCTSSEISDLNIANSKISSVSITSGDQVHHVDSISHFVWTLPPSLLCSFLSSNKKLSTSTLDKPLNQKYVYLLSKVAPRMDDIYYYYSFQPGTNSFRVTNYATYCPNSIRQFNGSPHWPICIEMHYPSNCNPDDSLVANQAISEIIASSVIDSFECISFHKVVSIPSGFPLLTIKNCRFLADARLLVNSFSLSNLTLAGQVPEDGIFYLHETLARIHSHLSSQ